MSREPGEAGQTREMPALASETAVLAGRAPILEGILRDVEGDLSRLDREPSRDPLPSVRFRRDLTDRADELHRFVMTLRASGRSVPDAPPPAMDGRR